MKLIQKAALEKWEKAFAAGTDKKYPSIDLVRLEFWHFGHPGKGRVLEYGFGGGVNTIHLLECGYHVVGVDAAQGAVDMVTAKLVKRPDIRDRAQLSRLAPDAESLPLEDNSVDFLVCVSVLSLLGGEAQVRHLLGEFRRVLKPGGKGVLDINDHDSEFSAGSERVEENVFLLQDPSGENPPVRCFCLKDAESFVTLVEPFFAITDIGYSGHKLFGRRINEWILSVAKR